MILNDQGEIEKRIKAIAIRVIKLYKGKGPNYVNVKITDNKIDMLAKGILSNLGKYLIEHGKKEVVEIIKEAVEDTLYKHLIDEIHKETNLKCSIICGECNYKEDFRRLILKIKE